MVEIYKNVKSFYEEYERLFREREAAFQLIVSNALREKDKRCSPEMFFGRSTDERGQSVLLFCKGGEFPLCIYSLSNEKEEIYVKELAQFCLEYKIPIQGINAKKSICESFIQTYEKEEMGRFKLHLEMEIMELRELVPISLAKGFSAKPSLKELELLTKWEILFAKEALGRKLGIKETLDKVRKKIQMGILYVYYNEYNQPVSVLNKARQLTRGVVLNEVYTPTQYRGRGYAQSNVYLASKTFLEEGNQYCCLFVDKKNPISNRVYQKIGYKNIGACDSYKWEKKASFLLNR